MTNILLKDIKETIDLIEKYNKLNYSITINNISQFYMIIYIKIDKSNKLKLSHHNIIELIYILTVNNLILLYKNNKDHNTETYQNLINCLEHLN
jgi:hypothetical protein